MNPQARTSISLILFALSIGACSGSTEEGLDAYGTIEAVETDLGFQIPGRLTEIGPREGERVESGDTLARILADELEAAVAVAEAQAEVAAATLAEMQRGPRPQELASARAALQGARDRESAARSEVERAERLFAGQAISEQALQSARTALETASSAREQAEQALDLAEEGASLESLAAQRARAAQAGAVLAQAQATLTRSVLLAPDGGIVTVRHREPGEIVSPGAPVLTIMDPEDRWVRIYISEDRVGQITLGQAAEIRIDAFPDEVFGGSVTFIGNEAEFTPRNVQTPDERTQLVYPVKVRIEGDAALRLKPGLPADVRLAGIPG